MKLLGMGADDWALMIELAFLFGVGVICLFTERYAGAVTIAAILVAILCMCAFVVRIADEDEDFPQLSEANRVDEDDEPIAVINYTGGDTCSVYDEDDEDYKRQDEENIPSGGCAIF